MDRREFVRGALASGTTLWAGLGPLRLLDLRPRLLGAVEVSRRAVELVSQTTVVDMLGLMTMDWPRLFGWLRDPTEFGESDFRRLERTGVRIFHPAMEIASSDPRRTAREQLAGWNDLLGTHPCELFRVGSFEELIEGVETGKLGVLLGMQNSEHFREASDVEYFHGLGQRVSQLTYNGRNRLGSGCQVERDAGLTDFGAAVIAEMNRVGMVIDVSHCGERTSADAILASKKPVLATHANCKALAPSQPRNKSDQLIRMLAARGGVMGITLVRGFIGSGSPGLDDVLDHFDHVARLVGAEHVGLGTDVSLDAIDPATGRPRPPYAVRGLDLSLRVFQIADGLLARGWGERDVELVLGGNFLRALGEIWSDGSWSAPDDPWALRPDPFCPPRRPPADSLGGES